MTVETTRRARTMRKALTPPEARMWATLKTLRHDGYHFRRQTPFRGYFLDFVCHSHRLVIEVDGATHETRRDHDALRDAVLLREGFKTLRFTNESVRDAIPDIMDQVRAALGSSAPTRPSLHSGVPPHEGEGE